MTVEQVDVAVVGAGPAGLALAVELRKRGVERVVVLEREGEPGGVPRHCEHPGFVLPGRPVPLPGPRYAAAWAARAERHGVQLRLETTVTRWTGERRLALTSPAGLGEVAAAAVVLATGCRERPRAARLVPGTRPAGVLTTGQLQRFTTAERSELGRRAVVVGAEDVSMSAVLGLRAAGIRVSAVVTEHPHHQTFVPVRQLLLRTGGTPLLTGTRVAAIRGRRRVEAVEVVDAGGSVRAIPCDLVVFTGDWIPEGEIGRTGGLVMDERTRGPRVDARFRTSSPGVFAVGNVVRGAESSRIVAAEGRRAAAAVADWLDAGRWPSQGVSIRVGGPIEWVVPNVVSLGETPARADTTEHLIRATTFVRDPVIEVRQGARVLWRGRPRGRALSSWVPLAPYVPAGRLVPTRSARIPGAWHAAVEPGVDVEVVVRERP